MEKLVCVFCKEGIGDEESAVLGAKGCASINNISQERGEELNVQEGHAAHKRCRKNYLLNRQLNNSKKRKSTESDTSSKVLRSCRQFNYKTDCFFCTKTIPTYHLAGKKTPEKSHQVKTKIFQETVKSKCSERMDTWANEILARIEYAQDLVATEAIYHQSCSVAFRSGRDIGDLSTQNTKRGRKLTYDREAAFLKVIVFLETSEIDQVTLQDLVQLMSEHLDENSEPFTSKHMKSRLIEHFGERLFVTDEKGKKCIVTLQRTASLLIQSLYKESKDSNPETQKRNIIETAAKLIKNDIKDMKQCNEIYPDVTDIESSEKCMAFIPTSLRIFLDKLISSKQCTLRIASVAHAIIQATRPKTIIAPLQLTLGVQLHLLFGSKMLIEMLNELGFCCSYNEVQKFEKSAAVSQTFDEPDLSGNEFIQFMADNVDHNVRTLDGRNTFHGMGMMATVTPGISHKRQVRRVAASLEDIAVVGRINIHFKGPVQNTDLTYPYLPVALMEDTAYNVDILWKMSWLLRPKTPLWNGTMQMIYDGDHSGESSTIFLPMIDMDPTNETCIYSTLHYIAGLSKKFNTLPVVTFDQPLWWKAMLIVHAEDEGSYVKKTVLRLGGLHIEMSFLGAIGHLMTDTGLKEVLQTVFADTTVPHMLNGKALSRAIRGHMLTETALTALIVSMTFDIDIPRLCKEPESGQQAEDTEPTTVTSDTENIEANAHSDEIHINTERKLLENAMEVLDKLMSKTVDLDEAVKFKEVTHVVNSLETEIHSLKLYRTAKLWIQYMDMLDILKQFIRAERIGDWKLHLHSISLMLPYFAACGRNAYTKSATLYLHNMYNLHITHPQIYHSFSKGFHVVRRTNRYWAGLSSDLAIEQILMRSVKTVGGMTRGRGMDEAQRSLWILSRPVCSEINNQMQGLIRPKDSNDKHKECSEARIKRDSRDVHIMIDYLLDRNPFSSEKELRSISSGVVASEKTNVDNAKQLGSEIVKNMEGQKVQEIVLRKKDQVIIMTDTATLKIDQDSIKIDPQLLFQRLITAAQGSVPVEDLKDFFGHELCTFPPSLFESDHLMRTANKATLANEMIRCAKLNNEELERRINFDNQSENFKYVIDGGSLLHKLSWPRGNTYNQICGMYVKYLVENYNKPIVVFDGYDGGPSTKDNVHIRRTGGRMGAEVLVRGDLLMNTKKQQFLLNQQNKQKFIYLMDAHLHASGIETLHAPADADFLIVNTAVRMASEYNTIVIGEDTDLLVLLCYHADIVNNQLFLQGRNGKFVNIPAVQDSLGKEICSNLLFIHAVLGCDTVSKPSGLGKPSATKMFKQNELFRKCAIVFNAMPDNVSNLDVIKAGEEAMLCLYHADPKKITSLNELRMKQFLDKTSNTSVPINPKSLPPTEDACKYHSLRVYHQILTWKGIPADPLDFGWEKKGSFLYPITTRHPAAPDNVLKVVRCSCKTGCKTMACSCRKLSLPCSIVCKNCSADMCVNLPLNTLLDICDDEDDA